jgi:DNA methylase
MAPLDSASPTATDFSAQALQANRPSLQLAYETKFGKMFRGYAEQLSRKPFLQKYLGRVQLLLTSPPFPLIRKKRYGNLQGEEYVNWLASFAPLFKGLLAPQGSIVIEVGNAWEPGRPVMSPLSLQALLGLLESGSFNLCQQFICYNRAKLPGPAEWVTIRRIRVKDAYTHIWWMSTSEHPQADNRRVLTPYGPHMMRLLEEGRHNFGERPSGHTIGEMSFLKDNGGSIPPNVLEVTNTVARDNYLDYCRRHNLNIHPARMASKVAEFFVKFLTVPGDLVLDPFAGSNVTGATAEQHGRRWVSIEPNQDYIASSRGRFPGLG